MSTQIPLDDIDRHLIDALQRDGRATYAELAELVGLSPAATRLRVQRPVSYTHLTLPKINSV